MRKSLALLLFILGCLPAKALADGITCTVTGPSSVTVMESSDSPTGPDGGTCKLTDTGVPLPSSDVHINILESQSDPDYNSQKPVSDFMEINNGELTLNSDDESGMPLRQSADITVTEPGGFGPVQFDAGGTTYTVFSDVAPEPSTILLFGSGLLALFTRRKRR